MKLLLLIFALTLTAFAQLDNENYITVQSTYIQKGEDFKDLNFGTESVLEVSKEVGSAPESRGLVQTNLEQQPSQAGTSCNRLLQYPSHRQGMVLDTHVTSVSDCHDTMGCVLELHEICRFVETVVTWDEIQGAKWNGGKDMIKETAIDTVVLQNGFSGKVSFDLSAVVNRPEQYFILLLKFKGKVVASSTRTGNSPNVHVPKAPLVDTLPSGISEAYLELSNGASIHYLYGTGGDPSCSFVFWHGLGSQDLLWTGTMDVVRQRTGCQVLAPTLLGHGFSDKWDDFGTGFADFFEPPRHIDTMTLFMQEFETDVSNLGNINFVDHDQGGPIANELVKTIYSTRIQSGTWFDTWIQACPASLEAQKLCHFNTVWPRNGVTPDPSTNQKRLFEVSAAPTGEFIVYAFGAFDQLIQGLTVRILPQAFVDMFAGDAFGPIDPNAFGPQSRASVLSFPRYTPSPKLPGDILAPGTETMQAIYDAQIASLKATTFPKLILTQRSDQFYSPLIRFPEQLKYIRDNYGGEIEEGCVGYTRHFGPIDQHLAFGEEISRFYLDVVR